MTDERLDLWARARADLLDHPAAAAHDDLLLGVGLDVDVRADRLVVDPSTSTVIACGTSSRVSASAFSRTSSATCSSVDRSVRCSGGKYAGPSGSSSTGSSRSAFTPSPVRALTGWIAWKSPSLAAFLELLRDVTRLEAVDLVQRDHDVHAEVEDPLGDEPVAGADAVARVEHEQHAVDVLERRIDGALHVLGERVRGRWKPGRSARTSCPVLAVRHSEDPPPRRLRLVRDDRDLAAAERFTSVDLPTFGRPATATMPDCRTNESGSRSDGVTVTTSPFPRRYVTRSSRHSASHCRQPPHARRRDRDLLEVARLQPGRRSRPEAAPLLAQIPSG